MVVDLLILGAGWTSTFLIDLCRQRSVSFSSTTRSGAVGTIRFEFEPELDDLRSFEVLPDARTVLITFPIVIPGAHERLIRLYKETRRTEIQTAFIQLGATSIWELSEPEDKTGEPFLQTIQVLSGQPGKWLDRRSPFAETERSLAEKELLDLAPTVPVTVLHLACLWGGSRHMKNLIPGVVSSKEALRHKGSLHMIHGLDVARAILAVHSNIMKAWGHRWILTDGRVYDWWDLASAWSPPPPSSIETNLKARNWRLTVQKAFLSERNPIKAEDMPVMDELFKELEAYEDMGLESLQTSKIGKVMRHITLLDAQKIPFEEQFHFRDRAEALVQRWILRYEAELAANKNGGSNSTIPADWVRELMRESGVRALPRKVESLGCALDSLEFWETFGLNPTQTLINY